jgi:hypothetical protein
MPVKSALRRETDAVVERVRDILDWTFGQFGYVRVHEPATRDEIRSLVIQRFQLALIQEAEALRRARSGVEIVRTTVRLLDESADKVQRDLEDADEYARLGPTDDERTVGENVEDLLPPSFKEV